MKELKGKDEFTADTINKLEELIKLRIKTPQTGQKSIRQKMRKLGFYGRDDWGISDMQVSDLHSLIKSGRIKIIDGSLYQNSSSRTVSKPMLTTKPRSPKSSMTSSTDIDKILESFKSNCFDPKLDGESKISDCPGNYILCLHKKAKFPRVSISPTFTKFEGLNVIYTGIAGRSGKNGKTDQLIPILIDQNKLITSTLPKQRYRYKNQPTTIMFQLETISKLNGQLKLELGIQRYWNLQHLYLFHIISKITNSAAITFEQIKG